MEFEDLKKLLNFLKNVQNNNYFGNDTQIIQYFYDQLEKIKNELPTSNELDKLQNIERNLETTYDEFNELSYYFTPVYIKIKNKIHEENVRKIRENNKKKRSIN